jgi:hypothetical protein
MIQVDCQNCAQILRLPLQQIRVIHLRAKALHKITYKLPQLGLGHTFAHSPLGVNPPLVTILILIGLDHDLTIQEAPIPIHCELLVRVKCKVAFVQKFGLVHRLESSVPSFEDTKVDRR